MSGCKKARHSLLPLRSCLFARTHASLKWPSTNKLKGPTNTIGKSEEERKKKREEEEEAARQATVICAWVHTTGLPLAACRVVCLSWLAHLRLGASQRLTGHHGGGQEGSKNDGFSLFFGRVHETVLLNFYRDIVQTKLTRKMNRQVSLDFSDNFVTARPPPLPRL